MWWHWSGCFSFRFHMRSQRFQIRFSWIPQKYFNQMKTGIFLFSCKKKFSPAGNRSPVSHMTGGDTHHYTTEDLWWITLIDNRCLREPAVLETILQVPLDRCLFYFRRKKILQTAPDKLVGVSKQQGIQSSLRAEGKIRYTSLYS